MSARTERDSSRLYNFCVRKSGMYRSDKSDHAQQSDPIGCIFTPTDTG